mgnify:CR=1 FL=1
MKKIIQSLYGIVIILSLLIGLDVYSIYTKNKPIFILSEEVNGLNKVYRGVFYDTFNCAEYSALQIKLKNDKFSCPSSENSDINKESISNSNVKITLVGDLLFEQPYYDALNDGEDKNKYFNRVKKYFQNDDISVGNMEVVIGNDKLSPSGTGYNFCAPEYIGDLVNTLDFEVLGTANNHSFDRGTDGVNSTIDFFKNNTDIVTVGTYKDIDDRNNSRIIEINNIKFGFLAYTYGTNQKPEEDSYNLIGYYKNPKTKELTPEYKNILKEEIERIRKASDVVIVLMHWGLEFTYTPNNEQKEMASYLNELGVDIIVGSHSHNIQPIEVIGDDHKTLVYYSLGNFVSHDNDIARTKEGVETFDNAYQVGLLSTLNITKNNNIISFDDIDTELIINYFDKNMRNFELVPYKDYSEKYETSHYRYSKGLTKEFIDDMYEKVIDEYYRK